MNDVSASDLDSIIALAGRHDWIALGTLIAWALVRIVKSDQAVAWFPVQISPLWRSWAALIFGEAFAVLHKLTMGGTWGEAIVGGLAAGGGATVLHELIVESLRQGRDIGVKKEDAPPPPPPERPISLKPPSVKPPAAPAAPPEQDPPATTRFVGGFILGAVLVAIGFVLCDCVHPSPLDEVPGLVIDSAACRRKGLALIADGGTCQQKRARVLELVATDPDCADLYGDAGPVMTCKAVSDGGTDR